MRVVITTPTGLELEDMYRCTSPTRDYMTKLRYIEMLLTEQLVSARQRRR